jgi:tetratricopeptide (TPR) repeat protein
MSSLFKGKRLYMLKKTYLLRTVIIAIAIISILNAECFATGEEDALQFPLGAYNDGFYDVAEQGFASFVEKYGYSKHRPYALYLLGMSRFAQKKYAASKEALSELTKLYPKYERIALAHYFLGEAGYLSDDYATAQKSYQYIYNNPPADVSRDTVLFRLGELNFVLGDYKGAKDVLTELKNDFKDYEHIDVVRLYLSFSYYYTEEYQNAFNEFEYILTKPKLIMSVIADAIFFAADSAFKIKNYKSSLKYSSDFLKNFANGGRKESAVYYRAMSLYFTNDKETALKELKKYLEDYPKGIYSDNVIEQLANSYFEVKQYKNANIYFKRLVKERSGSPDINDWLIKSAWCYTNSKDYKKASQIYEELEGKTEDDAARKGIMLLRAEAYYLSKEYLKAFKIYDKLKDDAKYKKEVIKKLADCHFYLREYKAAIERYTTYIKKYSGGNDDEALLRLAVSVQNVLPADQHQEALMYYEKIISHKKGGYYYKTALYNAILLYEAANDTKKLKNALRQYVDIKGVDAPSYFYLKLANIYFLEDSRKNAIKYYERALKSNEQDVMGESLFKLGRLYYKQKDLKKSLEHLDLAMDIFSQAKNVKEMVLIHLEKGNIHGKQKDLKKARNEYLKVIEISADEELKNIASERIKDIDKKLGKASK